MIEFEKDDWLVIKEKKTDGYFLVNVKSKTPRFDFYWGQSSSWCCFSDDTYEIVENIGKNKKAGTWDKMEIDFIKKYKYPKSISEYYQTGGWLSPNGDFYPCKNNNHSGLAKKLSATYINTIENPERDLELNGWLKVMEEGRVYDAKIIVSPSEKTIVTEHQMFTLAQFLLVGDDKWKNHISNFIHITAEIE